MKRPGSGGVRVIDVVCWRLYDDYRGSCHVCDGSGRDRGGVGVRFGGWGRGGFEVVCWGLWNDYRGVWKIAIGIKWVVIGIMGCAVLVMPECGIICIPCVELVICNCLSPIFEAFVFAWSY